MPATRPSNLRLAEWRFGPMCTTCKYLEVKDEDGKYLCTKYDLNVRHNDICDDYTWDGNVRVA